MGQQESWRDLLMTVRKGMTQIFLGNGRLETSAALGTALRSAGYGLKIHIALFNRDSAEHLMNTRSFEHLGNIDSETIHLTSDTLSSIVDKIFLITKHSTYDLIVFDQILTPAIQELLGQELIMRIMTTKHDKAELILTGISADAQLLNAADVVTRCECENR